MLVDEPLVMLPDPMLNAVAIVNKRSPTPIRLAEGIYEIGHFGSSNWPPGYEDFFDLEDSDFSAFGVCDFPQQVLDQCPELRTSLRHYILTVHRVRRDEQDQEGGWRWHKWGPYIGTQTPTAEYLVDEPLIEQVFVYHIHLKRGTHEISQR